MILEISTLEREGVYEAAKWLKLPVLADETEFADLFSLIPGCELYPLGKVIARDELPLSKKLFLSAVRGWVEKIQRGEAPQLSDTKSVLACALTATPDALYLQEVGINRFLVKLRRPVIQIQAHFFSYAREDETFHSMVCGLESVFWGIQFSYPQIFLDVKEGDLGKVGDEHSNTAVFQKIRLWSRNATKATPFLIQGKKVNVPIRLGKRCFSWIGKHPQLLKHQLGVAYVD